jgi:hypothetical protein
MNMSGRYMSPICRLPYIVWWRQYHITIPLDCEIFMSNDDGWAAMNLEMPSRIPRTEYSAEGHWELVSAVTGKPVTPETAWPEQHAAQKEFMDRWDYDLVWSTLIAGDDLGEWRTRMGHAEYAAGGVDFSAQVTSPFTSVEQVLAFDPLASIGAPDHAATVKRFEDHYRAEVADYPDAVRMTGIYTTCVSGLIDLLGWDWLLLAAGTDPQRFADLTRRYNRWVRHFFEALADTDVPVVMVHDDIVWSSGPFMDPRWYRECVFPAYREHFRLLHESGKKILFTADGNYTMFVDDIAACGVHGFVMEPMTDMAYVAARYGSTHVIVGNADTRILLCGSRDEIRAEVERCMAIGRACPGFFMAVGNHIPANTPVGNAVYYNECYEEMSRR